MAVFEFRGPYSGEQWYQSTGDRHEIADFYSFFKHLQTFVRTGERNF